MNPINPMNPSSQTCSDLNTRLLSSDMAILLPFQAGTISKYHIVTLQPRNDISEVGASYVDQQETSKELYFLPFGLSFYWCYLVRSTYWGFTYQEYDDYLHL